MPLSIDGRSTSRYTGVLKKPNPTLTKPLPTSITDASSSHEPKLRTPVPAMPVSPAAAADGCEAAETVLL